MKYVILITSVLVQICLGGVYAWSTFVPDLKAAHGLSTAQTQLIFGVEIAVFTISMVIAGRVLEKLGPRVLVCVSGILLFAGYLLASLSNGNFVLLLLGISVIVGTAIGCGYVCPLSTCMKWFPKHKGLITGVAVAGFGAGAIALANSAEVLLKNNIPSLTIFLYIAIVYGAIIFISGLCMARPPKETTAHENTHVRVLSVIKDPYFWALVVGLFCGTFAGLLIIGNLKPIAIASGLSPAIAALAISALSIGNAIGRIAWGPLVDIFKKNAIIPSLVGLAIFLAVILPATAFSSTFIFVSALIGFGFGGCFVIYAVLVAARFGTKAVGTVYPLIFLAYGFAGIVGPYVGGWLYDTNESYLYPIIVSISVITVGSLLIAILLYILNNRKVISNQSL